MATGEEILDRLKVVATWHVSKQRRVVDDIITDLENLLAPKQADTATDTTSAASTSAQSASTVTGGSPTNPVLPPT